MPPLRTIYRGGDGEVKIESFAAASASVTSAIPKSTMIHTDANVVETGQGTDGPAAQAALARCAHAVLEDRSRLRGLENSRAQAMRPRAVRSARAVTRDAVYAVRSTMAAARSAAFFALRSSSSWITIGDLAKNAATFDDGSWRSV